MKFLQAKFLKISSAIVILSPISIALSCSSQNNEYQVSTSDDILYSTIWNLSGANEIQNSFFNLTIEDLQNKINQQIKNDEKKYYLMKIYCFYLLWEAIKNPTSEDGSTSQLILSEDIKNFGTFLSNKLVSDDDKITLDDRTYNNLKAYINTFDFNISVINVNEGTIYNKLTLREVLWNNSYYVLNFKMDFWTSDEETNTKMVSASTGKSIMYKNNLSRSQREEIRKITNLELKELTTNQYSYQSTKLYYDAINKKFSTIVLPSNVYYNGSEETVNSGFATKDKSRRLFLFDFYSANENDNSYQSYLELCLSQSDNFNYSINSDWTNFLKKESYYKKNQSGSLAMENIKINLDINFVYDKIVE